MLRRLEDNSLVIVPDSKDQKFYSRALAIKFSGEEDRVYELVSFVVNRVLNDKDMDEKLKHELRKRMYVLINLMKGYNTAREISIERLIEYLEEKVKTIQEPVNIISKLESKDLAFTDEQIEIDEGDITFNLTEQQVEGYKSELFILVENKEDSYERELNTELNKIVSHNGKLSISRDVINNYYNYDITHKGYIVDEVNAMNNLVSQIIYILNSSSFRYGELQSYDKYELDMRFDTVLMMIERIPKFLRARLEMKQ